MRIWVLHRQRWLGAGLIAAIALSGCWQEVEYTEPPPAITPTTDVSPAPIAEPSTAENGADSEEFADELATALADESPVSERGTSEEVAVASAAAPTGAASPTSDGATAKEDSASGDLFGDIPSVEEPGATSVNEAPPPATTSEAEPSTDEAADTAIAESNGATSERPYDPLFDAPIESTAPEAESPGAEQSEAEQLRASQATADDSLFPSSESGPTDSTATTESEAAPVADVDPLFSTDVAPSTDATLTATESLPESSSLSESDGRAESNRSKVERAAWLLGSKLSLAALAHGRGAPGEDVQQLMDQSRSLARLFGITLDDLPNRPLGIDSDDVPEKALDYLFKTGNQIGTELARRQGIETAALFEIAVKSNVLLVLYEPGSSTVEAISTAITQAGARGKLPADLWQPLVDLLGRQAPVDEVRAGVYRLHADVERFLEGVAERR